MPAGSRLHNISNWPRDRGTCLTNKAGDLEKLRERSLLKEFEDVRWLPASPINSSLPSGVVRRIQAWQERDYATIVSVANKIPNNVLEEDPKLLMWYDQAITRMGGE